MIVYLRRSLSCQCRSLHGFQTSHFIWDQFDCKLWLWSIQNHARHWSQAFVHPHLKSLWCSIWILADALSRVGHQRSAVLHRIQNMRICSHVIIFTLRPMNDRRLSETMSADLVGNNFSPIPSKISFHMKTKWPVTARSLQSIKTFDFRTDSVLQICKSCITFYSSEPVSAGSDCRRLGNALGLCLPVQPVYAVPDCCLKGPAIHLAVKTLNYLLEYRSVVIARWPSGARPWTQTWTLPPDQLVVKVLSAHRNPRIICVELYFF